jgi:hypothetical protein
VQAIITFIRVKNIKGLFYGKIHLCNLPLITKPVGPSKELRKSRIMVSSETSIPDMEYSMHLPQRNIVFPVELMGLKGV